MSIIQWGDALMRRQEVACVARDEAILSLNESVWVCIGQGQVIIQHIASVDQVVYGINAGLGALCNITLPEAQLHQLSCNALLSHACGMRPLLEVAPTRAIVCAVMASFSRGEFDISAGIVQQLLMFLQHGVIPQVPSQGSVGHLARMAYIGLAPMGVGNMLQQGWAWSAAGILLQLNLQSIAPGAKEGLSLVSGIPYMTGLIYPALDDTERLMNWADVTGAMSFEALHGQLMTSSAETLALKASPGIQTNGQRSRELLADSRLLAESEGLRT